MSHPLLSAAAREALQNAVRSLEQKSGAELVIVVHEHSGSYLHAELLAGAAAGVGALVALTYLPWDFGDAWFVVGPVLAGAFAAAIASRWRWLRRVLTPERERRRRAETMARSLFVEKRIHRTSHRTGLLLYLSLVEREAVVVPDLGLEALTHTAAWGEAVGRIGAAMRSGGDGVEIAAALGDLAALLGRAVSRRADDVQEIPDEVAEQ